MGGGKGGKQTQEGRALAQSSKEILGATRPIRNEFSQQLLEVLQTGGSTARLPIIQQQVEGAKSAASQAVTGTTASLAQSGLDRTPFGQRILAETRQTGEQAQNTARFNVVNQLLGTVPNYALQSAQTGQQGLASAAATQSAANQQAAAAEGQTAGAVGSVAAAAIIAAIAASRRALKQDITDADLEGLHALALRSPLKIFSYKDTPETQRLGIVIEDVEDASYVTGDVVDLYSYATTILAAVQVQAQQIRALQDEIAALKAA